MLAVYPIKETNVAGWPTEKAVKKGARVLQAQDIEADESEMDIARAIFEATGLPELVSYNEIRAMLGTKNPRLPSGLPAPVYDRVGGRALWLKDDIEAFAKEFKRRPNVVARRQA